MVKFMRKEQFSMYLTVLRDDGGCLISIFTETTITKDNPAFSMVNDSDEDVIYGSDDDSTERRPLNSSTGKGNDYDSD